MGADYSFYVKFIATRAPTFFGYIISVLASVRSIKTLISHLKKISYSCFSQREDRVLVLIVNQKKSVYGKVLRSMNLQKGNNLLL